MHEITVHQFLDIRDHYLGKRTGYVGGWVQKLTIFADVQYCIYADLVGGWVTKHEKFVYENTYFCDQTEDYF